MKKIGVFGTCRIDNFNFDDFIQLSNVYPYIYKNSNFIINVRPLGYTTSTSDVLQNLLFIKNKQYLDINNDFILKNILYKHGGKSYIKDLDYDYLILEICSIKKIIHNDSKFIFPYEIEGTDPNKSTYTTINEEFDETVNNIIKIQKLLNCKIILIPPIYIYNGNTIQGIHESCIHNKVINYRLDILNRLKKAINNDNIILYDWNNNIKKNGIDKMLIDQFHFSEFGKKYNLKCIIDIINSNKIYFKNEQIYINIPNNIINRHRYYKNFHNRDDCEKYFRLLIKYLYDNNFIDINKNIIDLGAWIGDNSILWAIKINGIVYAIDPSKDNIMFIEELKTLNNISNIKTIQKCISDKIEYVFTNGDIKHCEFNIINGRTKLKTTTLDVLFNNNIIDNIGFIHLDVEGFEYKVLNGSLEIIKKFTPFIVWENHLDTDNYNKIIELLNQFEYNSYIINEYFPHCRKTCRNFISIPKNMNYIVNNINKLFIHDENKPEKTQPFLYKL